MSCLSYNNDSPSYYLSELCNAIEDVCGKCVSPSTVCKIIASYTYTCMDLHVKSYSMWQNKDPSYTVVYTWLKFNSTIVTVLSSLMSLDMTTRIT